MKLTVLQENLSKALQTVSRAVASRTATLPVLTHVYLATDGGRLKVAATNLELGITAWAGAKVEAEGAITVPARTFAELVALLPPDTVELSTDDKTHTLYIKCGRTANSVKGIDAQEFPIIPGIAADDTKILTMLSAREFKDIADRTVFAAATDESRPMLTGILWEFGNGTLTVASADGFRLSVCKMPCDSTKEAEKSLLVPSKAIHEAARIAGSMDAIDSDAQVTLYRTANNQALFAFHDVQVVSQLIDQRYPDYAPLIPKKADTRAVVSTADLLKACRLAQVFGRESSDTMHMNVTPPSAGSEDLPGTVSIRAKADETGDGCSEIEARVSGAGLDIGFNVKYMIDVLSIIDTPQVSIELTEPKRPALLKPVGDESFVHVVMPMHIAR